MPTFKTTVLQVQDMNATGIVVPQAVVEKLGTAKRPKVRVTLNGYTYRSTVAVMGGQFMLPLAAEHRVKAGVAGGDKVTVTLELDTAPREVEVPKDLGRGAEEGWGQDGVRRARLHPPQRACPRDRGSQGS